MSDGSPGSTTPRPIHRILTMAVLCGCGGTIYSLPYLFEVLYLPTQEALQLSKAQMGRLMGVFGAVSMLCYFPGGWLADRVSPRTLIPLAMIATGASGFYYSSFPGYVAALVLHAFWGVSITLVFWSAMIKATRLWAPREQQGRAFGILEGGRGLAYAIPLGILLLLFARMDSTKAALAIVVDCWSALLVLLGIAARFVLKDPVEQPDELSGGARTIGWREVRGVLGLRAVWLIALVIIAANSAYWATYYFTPYATEVFAMSVATAGAFGVARNWMSPVAAAAAGFIADRSGASRTVAALMLVTTISFMLFAITPAQPPLLMLVALNGAVAALCIFAMRGVYFAILDERNIPLSLTGTAAGVASAIGFMPDIYMPVLVGELLDALPGLGGYQVLFAAVAVMTGMGFGAARALARPESAAQPEAA